MQSRADAIACTWEPGNAPAPAEPRGRGSAVRGQPGRSPRRRGGGASLARGARGGHAGGPRARREVKEGPGARASGAGRSRRAPSAGMPRAPRTDASRSSRPGAPRAAAASARRPPPTPLLCSAGTRQRLQPWEFPPQAGASGLEPVRRQGACGSAGCCGLSLSRLSASSSRPAPPAEPYF